MSDLVGAVLTRPVVDTEDALRLLRTRWSIEDDVTLRALPSERDRNFAVVVDGVDSFVLKVSNATEQRDVLDFQHAALARLRGSDVSCPEPVSSRDGADIVDERSRGAPVLVRLMRWVPGRPLATLPPADRSEALLEDLGRMMGRVAGGLSGFDHPAAHRDFQWDPGRGLAVIDAHAPAVADPERAALLASWRDRLAPLADAIPTLPHGVIHNDANDHNVLVADDGSAVTGLLDFGDAVWSAVVSELAVAAAYAALDAADPIAVIDAVRDGFESERPLGDAERRHLVDLVALRLTTSVALSAHQSALDPTDAYLTVSEAAAWTLLDRLRASDPAVSSAAARTS